MNSNNDILLAELKQRRLNWVKANRENGFDEGINRLLTELYPDNAHFIYELLQNAEDPKATEVRFNLTDSAVEFEHNGERLFTHKDVESITSIGNSTKRDDATSIGKFGVGFKAVFAYTHTPEIHSGDFHFRIHDLVVPETDGVSKPSGSKRKTHFVFPFDNPKKPAARAVKEVETGLRNLGDNALLFLSHIRKIEYILPDDSTGSLQRIDHGEGRIEIRALHPGGNETVSHWLHFQKEVDVTDDDGKPKTCSIAIAYSLVEELNKKTEEKIWKIVPLPHGQVSIYFPAEKETSNLRFHLHAPFASTVARDSVRDCKANHELRDCIAELVAESLPAIRDQGLLTIGFLAVLPNPADNLAGNAPFYEPIRKTIVDTFNWKKALTPTRNGIYELATLLSRGPTRIAEVLDTDDLSLLKSHSNRLLWVANPPQQNQREDRFLESLAIETWGWSELVNSINRIYDDEKRERIETWISKKDDAWLMNFYALLGEACGIHHKDVEVNKLRIVRVATENSDNHLPPTQTFFWTDNNIIPPSATYFVKPDIYLAKGSDAQKKYAKEFLKHIGVRTLDAEALIDEMLVKYSWKMMRNKILAENSQDQPKKESVNPNYFSELRQFITYWKQKPYSIKKFSDVFILLDNDKKWMMPKDLCLDAPYLETGLSKVQYFDRRPVWSGYQEEFNGEELIDFKAFINAIGVMYQLEVVTLSYEEARRNRNIPTDWEDTYWRKSTIRWTDTKRAEDYSIQNLSNYLTAKDISVSRLIWNALIAASRRASRALFRPNQSQPVEEIDSQLVDSLKDHAWIPDRQGEFCKPQDMSRDDLRSDFPYDDRNGLLTAIGFGENARKRSEEYQAKNNKAQEIGFESAERAAKWAELDKLGISPDELLAQQKRAEQPEEAVPNPDRRRKGILERSENAPSKESVMRERSIQPGIANVLAEAKAYLRAKYTNPNSEMICQCCRNEMPFKVGDAYYFEAVQCVSNSHYGKYI